MNHHSEEAGRVTTSLVSWRLPETPWAGGRASILTTRDNNSRRVISLRVGNLTLHTRHTHALRLADVLVDAVEADRKGEIVELPDYCLACAEPLPEGWPWATCPTCRDIPRRKRHDA